MPQPLLALVSPETPTQSPLLKRMEDMEWNELCDFMSVLFLNAAQNFKDITPIGLAFSTACIRLIDEKYAELPDKDAQISGMLIKMGWPAHLNWRSLISSIVHSSQIYPILHEFGFADAMRNEEVHLRRMWQNMVTEELQKNPELETRLLALLDDSTRYGEVRRSVRGVTRQRVASGVQLEDLAEQFNTGIVKLSGETS